MKTPTSCSRPFGTDSVPDLDTLLDDVGAQLARLEGKAEELENGLATAIVDLTRHENRTEELEATLTFLQTMEAEWRERFQQGLAGVVSRGLTSVFGEEINVLLHTTTFRDTTSIELLIEQGALTTEVKGAKGGSLVQVLSFLLKVLMLISARPALHRTMVLDEPFAMVSREYRPRLCELLTELNARLGVQFIIVTHEPELVDCAKLAYEIKQQDGAAYADMIYCSEPSAAL